MNKIEKYQICPDDNELAMFVEGTLANGRMLFIKRHLETCVLCNEAVRLTMELNSIEIEHPVISDIDIVHSFAAQADRKLCVLYTEQYILQLFGIKLSIDELLAIAKQNKWIKHQGVQFKNIGKLMEYHSIQVERKTNNSLADLLNALDKGHPVIVGVDAGELFATSYLKKIVEKIEDWFDQHADHVLLVNSIHITDDKHGTIELINIDGESVKSFSVSVSRFLDAWEDSGRFMVIFKEKQL